MFENLSDRLSSVFKTFRGQKQLTEDNIQEGLREVRLALLEADVNFKVVKEFTENVKTKCLGQETIRGVNPAQQVIKIVHDELLNILGNDTQELNLSGKKPSIIMFVGLQGSGKTTSAGKLANMLRKKGKHPYLVPLDVYRPAAIDQLQTLAKQLDIPCYPSTTQMKPQDIANEAIKKSLSDYPETDVLLFDTAGRLHIDDELMQELISLKVQTNPNEILFVADTMTGQDAVNVAEIFHNKLELTGAILTKMDGDARGGVALSLRAVTNTPVKFIGIGEKLSDLEVFHPDRIAGRILGMGDILTLVEKAQATIDAEEAEELAKKMRKASFDLEDFRTQMRRIKKLGSLDSILKMIPGLGAIQQKLAEANSALPEKELARTEAIINSMTMAERHNPDILNGSRRARIAKGAGVSVAQVNQLVRQFEQMRKMMKGMLGGNKQGMSMPKGLMPNFSGLGQMPPMGLPDFPTVSKSSFTKKRKKRDKKKRK